MRYPRSCSFVFLVAFSFSFTARLDAQTYKFRHYGIEEGICHTFVYAVNQDRAGYLWLGTGEGLCRFDGFSFTGKFTSDSLPEAFVKKIFRDEDGNLWFGYNDGSITFYDGKSFRIINIEPVINSTINDITRDEQGNILFLTQNKGIVIVSKDLKARNLDSPFRGMLLSSFACINKDLMLIGGYDGLHLYDYAIQKDTLIHRLRFEGIPDCRVTVLTKSARENTYWVGTEDEGFFMLSLTDPAKGVYEIKKIQAGKTLQYTTILGIYENKEGILWLSTQREGVYKLTLEEKSEKITSLVNFNESNGLGSQYIRDVFEDIEGNIWISTYGNGLVALFNEAFTFYHYDDVLGRDINSVLSSSGDHWLGATGKLMKVSSGIDSKPQLFTTRDGLPDDRITALFKDSKGNLWIGSEKSGLYRMNPGAGYISRYHYSQNSLENTVNKIIELNEVLYVATQNGIVIIDLNTNAISHITTTDGLPHNSINDLFLDSHGNIWIAARSNGLQSINSNLEYRISGSYILEFVAIAEDNYGNLWAATQNDGVFKFLSDTLIPYSTYNGLKSGSCYSIINDRNGNILVGHRLGMSKINVDAGIVVTYGPDQGITGDCNPNAMAMTADGKVLIGTSDGLVNFNTQKEQKNITPPILNITSVRISDVEYDISKPVILPYGIYKLRIDYIGINLRAPALVTYKYKLNGYDDWSDPTSSQYVQYGRIEDGDYTFMITACNSEDICTDEPLTFHLKIKIPVWRTWWFISLSVITLILSVIFIIKFRERKQKQFQEMLQTRLDERTREVVMQKEQIEIKNKDITDSINYAQRIQASILPPISRLHDTFSGSFVFYQPRDIVSGDFYWYDTFKDSRFLIVCADSTGHGVPGAFMSMIGTTLIKDIISAQDIDSPAQLLHILDHEIMAALNQNIEAERSNDGMDIIVAEISLDSHFVRVSSAMRPMILYQNGEQIYVRGSRSAVGGQYEKEEKDFETNEFQLSKGDKIYMFSDGYPDQFGGPLGKKFKMVRLKNMLRDIHEKTMEEQYLYIKNNFQLWKEEHPQVDDVLFMGIEL